MRFIGITGGVGAGKTEILKYIGQHYKCEIYLADDIGHKVKEPGTEGYQALVELLGRDILRADGGACQGRCGIVFRRGSPSDRERFR